VSAALERSATARISAYVWALDTGGEAQIRACFAEAGSFAVVFPDERGEVGAEGREPVVELITAGLRAAPGRWHLVSNVDHRPAAGAFDWRSVCVVSVVDVGEAGPRTESLGVYEFDFARDGEDELRIARLRLRVAG
jgi:hypothetical protein